MSKEKKTRAPWTVLRAKEAEAIVAKIKKLQGSLEGVDEAFLAEHVPGFEALASGAIASFQAVASGLQEAPEDFKPSKPDPFAQGNFVTVKTSQADEYAELFNPGAVLKVAGEPRKSWIPVVMAENESQTFFIKKTHLTASPPPNL